MTRTSRRTTGSILAAGVLALALAVGATPSAASAADTGTGWLRLGHLSPDTKSVDVQVASLSGGSTLFELKGVTYGDVSPYSELAAGTYTVSMVPAGAAASTAPVISADVTIDAASATTVVAYGPSADLEVTAIPDDLAQPAAGNARIRLVQASTVTPEVDVATSTGTPIARGAKAGDVTGYAEVPAGRWTLELDGDDVTGSTDVDVAPGSVSTLFVLDTAEGGLTILPIMDSAASAAVPDGGVATGGGFLAAHETAIAAPRDGRVAY
jgi:hypothetical protein